MIRPVVSVLILVVVTLTGVGLGSLISAEHQPPAAMLFYPDRQERVPPDGTLLTLSAPATLRLAHADLKLSGSARFALKRHHASLINGWQVALELLEGQVKGRVQPKSVAYRLTLQGRGGGIEITGASEFVAYGLPNGDLLFGVLEGSARLLPNSAEIQLLAERQGVRLTADGRATRSDWAVMRAAAYRLDNAPLALPLHLTDSQGVTFTFSTGEVIGVPPETYRVTVQTLIPYNVEGLRLTADQPSALAFTFGEVVFRNARQGVTATLDNQIALRVAENENIWRVAFDDPLIAAPGRWSFIVQQGNSPEQRIEATVLAGRRTELAVR